MLGRYGRVGSLLGLGSNAMSIGLLFVHECGIEARLKVPEMVGGHLLRDQRGKEGLEVVALDDEDRITEHIGC